MEGGQKNQDVKFNPVTEGRNLLEAYTWFSDHDVIKSMVDSTIDVAENNMPRNRPLEILGIGVGTAKLETAIKNELEDRGLTSNVFVSDRLIEPLINVNAENQLTRFVTDNIAIPIANNCMDIVIARSVTHYEPSLYDEKKVLMEIKRILKPGGAFVDQAPTFLSIKEKELVIGIHALLPKIMNGQTKEETRQMLEEVFDVVSESENQTDKMLIVNKNDFIKRYLPNRDRFKNKEDFERAQHNFNTLIPKIIEMIQAVPEDQRPNVWTSGEDFGWNISFTIFICRKQ